jgi:beta-glucosidase
LQKWVFLICRENLLACAKHFVGDGGTHKGINEGNTICSPEDLDRIHMKPYPDCITQGVATFMASYSQWNGEPLHVSHYLLTDVLKGKLGFQVVHRNVYINW